MSKTENLAAVVVTHRVASYDTWKLAFDKDEPARRAAGIVAHHINRGIDDPNLVSIYLAAGSAAQLQAFLGNADLKATMMAAGVQGAPTFTLLEPQDDQTVKRDPLAGAIVSHDVADYVAWKKAFDAHGGARTKAGILGASVNRVTDAPQRVVIYLQAESTDAIRKFTASDDLKTTMKTAGVLGAPTIAFVTGDGWARY